MFFEVMFHVGTGQLCDAQSRYAFLERAARLGQRRNLTILAFGFGLHQVGVLVEGEAGALGAWRKGLRVGTVREVKERGGELAFQDVEVQVVDPAGLEARVAALHHLPVLAGASGPLASPWSSHRDLMRLRVAPFYDRAAIADRVEVRRVHVAAGGDALPPGWPPEGRAESLDTLLRLAAAVRGVLPADRRAFGLFTQLARARGVVQRDVAAALALSTRRVRQLQQEPDPLLHVALRCLGDARLRVVP